MAMKSGVVAVVGRPSAGKSTLVNTLTGQKVAIVSKTPQTTRNAIRGIVNREQGQLVFVDTPGQHISDKKLNKKLMDVAGRAASEAELILYVLDATREGGAEERAVADRLKGKTGKLVAALNKTDSPRADVARTRAFIKEVFPDLEEGRIIPLSALKNEGTETLLDLLYSLSPEGEAMYDKDYYTDQDLSFRISEIIRGEAIGLLRQELPHAIYVEVADAELRDQGKKLWVRAFIVTERESQKGMIVGKGGSVIKKIREGSIRSLKQIFDWSIELDLRVKTGKDWRQKDAVLHRLIDK